MNNPLHTLYVRVRHLGNTKGSIYLNDLDNYQNRFPELKIPVYVPFEGTIDIPLVDEVLISYNRGSLQKHVDNNLIEAFIFSEKGVSEVKNTTFFKATPNSDFILVNTSQGDVTVKLPEIGFQPEGKSIVIKKSTSDSNQLILETDDGWIDRESLSVATDDKFGAFKLKTGPENWWIVSEYPSGDIGDGDGTGGGDSGGDGSIIFPSQEEIFIVEEDGITSIQLKEEPVGPVIVSLNGMLLTGGEDHDYTLDGDTIFFEDPSDLFVDDLIRVLYSTTDDIVVSDGDGTVVEAEKNYPSLSARDSTDMSWVYVGKTEEKGQDEDDEVWQIYRQNIENTNLPQEFAEGIKEFTHRWTERENLNYEEI